MVLTPRRTSSVPTPEWCPQCGLGDAECPHATLGAPAAKPSGIGRYTTPDREAGVREGRRPARRAGREQGERRFEDRRRGWAVHSAAVAAASLRDQHRSAGVARRQHDRSGGPVRKQAVRGEDPAGFGFGLVPRPLLRAERLGIDGPAGRQPGHGDPGARRNRPQCPIHCPRRAAGPRGHRSVDRCPGRRGSPRQTRPAGEPGPARPRAEAAGRARTAAAPARRARPSARVRRPARPPGAG